MDKILTLFVGLYSGNQFQSIFTGILFAFAYYASANMTSKWINSK